MKLDKKLLSSALLFVFLPLVVLVAAKTTFWRPRAGTNDSPLAFLEQSLKIPRYVGSLNSLTIEALAPQKEATTSVESSEGTNGGKDTTKSYGREIIPTVLGTVSGYTGAMSFSLPITTPEGPGGFGPSVALSYSSAILDDSRLGDEYFREESHYPVSYTPLGFGLSGFAAITRDTRQYPDSPTKEGEAYHRFLVSLPTGEAFEIKYNEENSHWVTIPNAFVRVEHFKPGTTNNQPFADVTEKIGHGFDYFDAGQFIITTKDGTSYYFGEENLPDKIDGSGRIKGADEVNEDTWKGTKNGNFYNEFYRSTLENDDRDRNYLFVKKWLLRQVVAPNGQKIDYTYDVWQKRNQTNSESPREPQFLTTTAYPKTISWNEGKYLVDFSSRENLSNTNIDEEEYIRERIRKIEVKLKNKNSGKLETIRSYELTYFGEGEVPCGLEKTPARLSILKSFQEIGFDGTTKTPPTSFCYSAYNAGGSLDYFDQKDLSGNNPALYITKVQNGYGGETEFQYEMVTVAYYNKKNDTDATTEGLWGSTRARLTRKVSTDTINHKSSAEVYTYPKEKPVGYAEELGNRPLEERDGFTGGHPPTGLQFLGHAWIEVKKYDFTTAPSENGKLLSHTRASYFQVNQEGGCFEPHPARGSTSEEITYNKGAEAEKKINMYRYRFEGVADQDPSLSCDPDRIDQPLFVYLRREDTIKTETESNSETFIPNNNATLSGVRDALKKSVRTGKENLVFDNYGFITHSADLGEMNLDGSETAEQKKDNRYFYTYNVYDVNQWILGLPYLTYTATNQSCEEKDQSCQYNRTELIYDDNKEASSNQDLQNGYLTESRSFVDRDKVAVTRNKYDKTYGLLTETKSSKPNFETTKKVGGDWDLIRTSATIYDAFYHTLVEKTVNALDQQVIFEDYHPLLQVPQRIRTQTKADKFQAVEMSYDALGREVASFIPSDSNPETVLGYPATLTTYFEGNGEPLAVRTMSLKSITPDGKYNYQAADLIYDGLGQVDQSQILATRVLGQKQKIVTQNQYDANGRATLTLDPQVTGAKELGNLAEVTRAKLMGSASNWALIRAKSPAKETLSLGDKDVTGTAEFDELGRPTRTVQKDRETGQELVSTTAYLANAVKTIDQKGNTSVTILDSRGRTLYTVTADSSWSNIVVSRSSYEQTMVDKPTRTEIFSPSLSDKTETISKYDAAGRLVETTEPSLGNTKYTLDILGNLVKEQRSGAGSIETTYDKLNRVEERKFAGKLFNKVANNQKSIVYKYDTGTNAIGRVYKVSDLSGQEDFTYDGLQRTTVYKKSIFDKVQIFTTKYNKLSQITSLTTPDAVYTYTYDDEGRIANIKLNSRETIFEGALYDKYGDPQETNVAVGSKKYTEKTTFDGLRRLKNLSIQSSGNALLDQTLSYNQSAEIEGISESVNGVRENLAFEYDPFSRLVAVKSEGKKVASYGYDIFNRITKRSEGGSQTEMKYSNTFPFFAPKSIGNRLGENVGSTLPPVGVNPNAGSTTPLPTNLKTTGGGTTQQTTVTSDLNTNYTGQGALTEDLEACYEYNDLNQLVVMNIKKSTGDKCPLNANNSTKKLFFYYDHAGKLVFQEEFDPKKLQSPLKQTYFFGDYEEVYESK